jgi:hypothetical protein
MSRSEEEPSKDFAGQRDDENLIVVFRRHIIAMRKGFYLLLIPFALSSIPALIWPVDIRFFYLALAGFGLGLILFAYQWVGWYYTYFILTDQRLRQVNQQSLFGRSVVDLDLSKIQNISYNIPGFSGEVLGFGTIVVQTYVGDLILDRIHHPETIYNQLLDAIKDVKPEKEIHE